MQLQDGDLVRDLVLVAPLENLKLAADCLPLGIGVSIDRLTSVDYRHLSDTYQYRPDFHDLHVTAGSCTHAIKMELRGSRNDLVDDPSLSVTVMDVVTSLRLLRPGRMGVHYTWVRGRDGSSGWLRHPHLKPAYSILPGYRLNVEDADALRELFEKGSVAPSPQEIRVGVAQV